MAHPVLKRLFTEGLPESMRRDVVAELDTKGYEKVGENGKTVTPFEKVREGVPCATIGFGLIWLEGVKGGEKKERGRKRSGDRNEMSMDLVMERKERSSSICHMV